MHGESPLSDETAILLAVVPDSPANFARIDERTLDAGQIRLTWTLPSDEGGDPVTGYNLYSSSTITSIPSTQNTLTLTDLSVGQL